MKRIRVGVCVVACASWFSARPARAASPLGTSAQGECARANAARGEGKFTGQISRTPAANTFEVVAAQQSASPTGAPFWRAKTGNRVLRARWWPERRWWYSGQSEAREATATS